MSKIRVYIASPYTHGWHADNVRLQLEAKHMMMDYGFVPFAPLINHFDEIFRHREEKEWYEWDLEWLKQCNCVVRIRPNGRDGKEIPSNGADEEEKYANDLGIPVFVVKDLTELEAWCKEHKGETMEEMKHE